MAHRMAGFVDHHAHLLQVASGAIPTSRDPYTPRPITADPDASAATARYHHHVHAKGSTPMDEAPRSPSVNDANLPDALRAGLLEAARLGLVEITEAGMNDWRYHDALLRLRERGPLPLRVRLLVASGAADLDRMRRTGDPWLEVIGVKFYADGWLVPGTCALGTGDGIRFLDADTLARRAARYAEAGWTIATHAIGDAAVETVLDAYQRIYGQDGAAAAPRIEHAQILRRDLIDRMAESGVIACVQPSFPVADAPTVRDRLAGEQAEFAYRWDILADAGGRLIAGSDFPVETLSPLWGLQRLVTGADIGGQTVALALPIAVAMHAMSDPTAGAVTLSDDPLTVPREEIHAIRVVATEPTG